MKTVVDEETGVETEVPDDEEEPQQENEEDDADAPVVGDVLGEARLLEEAGVGLSSVENYGLAIAMKRLLEKKGLLSVRFFGKIFGTVKNYYILECDPKPSEGGDEEEAGDAAAEGDAEAAEGEESGDGEAGEQNGAEMQNKKKPSPYAPAEKTGTGSNRYVYYVSNSPVALPEQWVQLPNVTPEMVMCARYIKKLFRGNLDAPVDAHPPFPGTEKEYLRAQIARIYCSATIAPRGIMEFEQEPEEEEEEESEDGKPKKKDKYIKAYQEIPVLKKAEQVDPLSLDLTRLDNWVHITPTLLQEQGRCALFVPEGQEEEEEEEEEEDEGGDDDGQKKKRKKKKKEIERILPLLISIGHEKPMEMNSSEFSRYYHLRKLQSWIMCKCRPTLDNGTLVCVKSTRWPGSYSVAKISQPDQVKFVNVYVGYGHKAQIEGFCPVLPADLQLENSMPDEDDDDIRVPGPALVEQMDPSTEQMKQYIEPPKPAEVIVQVEEQKAEGEEGQEEGGDEGEGAAEAEPGTDEGDAGQEEADEE